MKKILLLLSLSVGTMFSQENPDDAFSSIKTTKIKLRHIKGFYYLDGSYAISKGTKAWDVNVGYFINNKSQITVGGNWEFGKIGYTNVVYKTISVGQQQTIYKIKDLIYFNTAVEGFVGAINYDTPELDTKKQVFNYGFGAGANAEIYLVNFCSLLLSGQQQYHFKDELGKFHYSFSAGLRFYVKP